MGSIGVSRAVTVTEGTAPSRSAADRSAADTSVGRYTVGTLVATRNQNLEVVRTGVLRESDSPQGWGLKAALDGRPALVFLSPTVDRLFGSRLRDLASLCGLSAENVVTVPTGEANKTPTTVGDVLGTAGALSLPRDGVFVGVGGGVLLDTVGFAASQFRRGVGHLKIPTTLLAQVDAAIGLKCGVNFGRSKNLLGAFHPPERTLVDAAFLGSLPPREIRCGLAEVLKLAVICDRELFDALRGLSPSAFVAGGWSSPGKENVVDRAIATMLDQLEVNPFEAELRRPVDFGHTISPSLEAESGFRIKHGEAVAVDIAFFCAISVLLGLLDADDYRAILDLIADIGLNAWHGLLADAAFLEAALDAATAHRGRSVNQPMPTAIGACTFVTDRAAFTPSLLRGAARAMEREFERRG